MAEPHQAATFPRLAAGRARAVGIPTRGTTAPNRLRRNDNWITASPAVRASLRQVGDPLVIDLGYGATGVTTVELAARLRHRVGAVRVLGLEIDPARVAAALPAADPPRLDFAVGGFEFAGRRPHLVRAMNVLRQYPEAQAWREWDRMRAGLAPGGVLVEGTCNELGRIGSWVLLDRSGPQTLTLSCSVRHLDSPARFAERLPKVLIHRNVPGEPIHRLLRDLTAAWEAHTGLAVFSAGQRFAAAVAALASDWPILSTVRAHRRGELTVRWSALSSSNSPRG